LFLMFQSTASCYNEMRAGQYASGLLANMETGTRTNIKHYIKN